LKDSSTSFTTTLESHIIGCNERFSWKYPLHQAVFDRDLVYLCQLCNGEDRRLLYVDLEQTDPMGNTALILALKLNYLEEATVLLDFGADPNYSPDPTEPSPYEHAIAVKNKPLLTRMLAAISRLKLAVWDLHREVSCS
jgi:ankyrin repeat protein